MSRPGRAGALRRATRLVVAHALLWLLPAPAQAASAEDEEGAAQVALAAAEVVDQHCADVAAGQTTEYAEALVAVTPVLAQVSRAYDKSSITYLLYWRGLLSACVGQSERGLADLEAFLAAVGTDKAYAAQATIARNRVRRLTGGRVPQSTLPQAAPGIVAGGVLLGAGGVFAGLSGWQGQATADAQTRFALGARPWQQTDAIGQEWQDAASASNGLLVASIGSGVAGAVVLIASAGGGRKSRLPSAALLPLPEGGVALQLGGRW